MTTIEIKIAAPELAAALNNLAAAIAGGTPRLDAASIQTAAQVEAAAEPEKPKRAPKPKAEAPSETAPEAEPAVAEPAPTVEASSSTSQSAEPEAVTYPDVQARVIGLAKHSRDAATGLLGEFGVSHGKELKEEQWAEFVAAADAKIAELEAK